MPTAGIDSLAVALALTVLFARLRVAFVIVAAATVLIPATLAIRNPYTTNATFTRILVLALAVRLLVALRSGEVPGWAWRWTTLHTAFAVFLLATMISGIVFAQSVATSARMVPAVLLLLEQFLFFAVALACVRAIGDLRWVLGVVAGVLLVSVGVGIIEHVTGGSWGHFLFRTEQEGVSASDPLEQRSGHVRVRAGAEYALQFGWVTVMLLPALLARLMLSRTTLRRWVPAAIGLVGAVLVAEYWAYSRTALAAIGGVALITAVAARERRLLVLTGIGIAAGVGAFLLSGSLQNGFVGLPSGYVDVRTSRLPAILGAVAAHPWHGLGLGGLASSGVVSTDSSYLQLYGDTGLLGLVTGIGLLVSAGACCLGGLRSRIRQERIAAAAGLAASVAMLIGGVAYDALRSLSSALPFWLLVTVGVVATERVRGPLPALVRRPRWLVAGSLVAAVAVGAVAFALAPVHHSREYEFFTVSAVREAQVPSDPVTTGTTFVGTVCGLTDGVQRQHPRSVLSCRDPHLGAGQGLLRIQSSSAADVDALARDVERAGTSALPVFVMSPTGPIASGRATAPGWALLWLPLGMLLALALLPGPGLGRTPNGHEADREGRLIVPNVRRPVPVP